VTFLSGFLKVIITVIVGLAPIIDC